MDIYPEDLSCPGPVCSLFCFSFTIYQFKPITFCSTLYPSLCFAGLLSPQKLFLKILVQVFTFLSNNMSVLLHVRMGIVPRWNGNLKAKHQRNICFPTTYVKSLLHALQVIFLNCFFVFEFKHIIFKLKATLHVR